MKTVLEAAVDIRIVTAVAELAIWRERPELQSLCAAAWKYGALDERAIEEMLPGLSPRGWENILRRLEHDRLLDRHRALTKFGERCARTGRAPAWEQGAYRFLVADHRFFGSHVLDFKRPTGGDDRRFDASDTIPDEFPTGDGRVFESAFDSSNRFSVEKFLGKSCRIEPAPAGKLLWKIDFLSGDNEWTLEGKVGKWHSPREFRCVGGSEPPEEAVGMFRNWEPHWNPNRKQIAMAYDGRAGQEEGRESFLRDRTYGPVRAGRFGAVGQAVVRDVPVGPAKPEDAPIWAAAIAVARVEATDAYMTPDCWRSVWRGAIENTPLSDSAGDAPPPAALSGANDRPLAKRTKWLLTAAADLGADP